MPDVNSIYHALKERMINQQVFWNEVEIRSFARFIYLLFSADKINKLFDTSGDGHKPEVLNPPLNTGKAVSGVRRPDTASTRQIVIDEVTHNCKNCGLVIKPGEKYVTHLKLYDDNGNTLPRPRFEAEHIECPED